jgi:hypothetical protein
VSKTQWVNKYCTSSTFDNRLPKNPDRWYADKEWTTWEDFLGHKSKYQPIPGNNIQIIREHVDYEQAKRRVKLLGIKSKTQWATNFSIKKPEFDGLPRNPHLTYKTKWTTWDDFLDIEPVDKTIFYSFSDAKAYVHKLGLASEEEWLTYKRQGLRPNFIPGNPREVYRGEFCGWMDFLGYVYHTPKLSRAELKIKNFLLNNNIYFESEKLFNGCSYTNLLPFDFFLPNYNLLIEYDGEHHFKPIKLYGGEKYFRLTLIKDQIKTQWAVDNGINLLRITYKDYKNINQILSNKLTNL